jgi:hypothetical protein
VQQKLTILFLFISIACGQVMALGQQQAGNITFDFCGDTVAFTFDRSALIHFPEPLSDTALFDAYAQIDQEGYLPMIDALRCYKQQHQPDDWLYYQLIRRTAQEISPKADNYHRYTFYKWFLLAKSGYDVMLNTSGSMLLFYVQSDENIYNIPSRIKGGKQYVCLNYHDYKKIDFEKNRFAVFPLYLPEATKSFSYKVTRLPDFEPSDYIEKDLQFDYNANTYAFKVKLNTRVQQLFANYPVVDYASYFNIPLSKETSSTLIPALKKRVKGLSTKNGVDYLMHFTRYAFLFQPDSLVFGGEKRMIAEQTLFSDQSDCEDRASLFFCLVKEIYNLPMIVLSYPKHVTIAVQFEKPVGNAILYNGRRYSVCEPTPQGQDLGIGQMIPALHKTPFEVVFAYNP